MKKEKVLIIKTGYSEVLHNEYDSRKTSKGDVLRTTTILHLFKNGIKNDHVTWVTDESAIPLLAGNRFIDRLLSLDWITAEQLKQEQFDTIINLEKIPGICVLADSIKAWKRYGFRSENKEGEIKAEAHNNAFEVLSVSSDLQTKKQNLKTTQELLFEMLGEKWKGEEYILGYQPKSEEIYDIGLNTKIGAKWPTKAWPVENWDKLKELLEKDNLKVSRDETTINGIKATEGDIYHYMNWINSCKLIVSNDSLVLHLAIALKKKAIGLFGSTFPQEVFFYGRGKVILPEKTFSCLHCYSPKCTNNEFCMEYISPEKVYNEVKSLL